MIVGFSRAVAIPLSVTLETNKSGSWAPVTGASDATYEEVAPASGPDGTDHDVRAVVTGGVPPYTYLWVRRSGSSRITANASTSSQTGFDIDAGAYVGVQAIFDCEVTDAALTTASATQDCQAVFTEV